MDSILKKYVDSGDNRTPEAKIDEFHCSRTWFDGEKPIKFKKGFKASPLCIGGVQYQQTALVSVKSEPTESSTEKADSLMVLQEPMQKGKHLAHLLK